MTRDDGAPHAPAVTAPSTEEMGVHKPCQQKKQKQNVHKGETSDVMRLLGSSNNPKTSQLITHAAGDQGGDGLCPGCLSRMTWKGNAALRKSAWIRLYKAVCTVNISVSWVWVLLKPLKGRKGGGNLNVCQINTTAKKLRALINIFVSVNMTLRGSVITFSQFSCLQLLTRKWDCGNLDCVEMLYGVI